MAIVKKGSEGEIVAVVLEDGKYEKINRKTIKEIYEKTEKHQVKLLKDNPIPEFEGIGKNTKKITLTNVETGKSLTFESITKAAKHFQKEKLLADSLGDRLRQKSSKPYKGYIIS